MRESLGALVDERLQSPGLPNPFAALYRASPAKAEPPTLRSPSPANAAQERRQRRVTFSAVQEQTYVARLTQRL